MKLPSIATVQQAERAAGMRGVSITWLGHATFLLKSTRGVRVLFYGTFAELTGTPDRLRELVEPRGIRVLELSPGETV